MDFSYIQEKAISFGIYLDDQQALFFQRYITLLLQENEKYNLTRITDEDAIVNEHLLEPIAVFLQDDSLLQGELLDLGTGAGFPGLPLKIFYPSMRIFLADSSRKKIAFLRLIIRKLNLENVFLLNQRAEDMGRDKYREYFDHVLARALAPLVVSAELALPLVKVGGIFTVFKSAAYQEELKNADRVIKACGGRLLNVISYNIAPGKERAVLFFEKVDFSSQKFPRRAGIPQKRPFY